MQGRSRSPREIARQLQKLQKLATDLPTAHQAPKHIQQLELLDQYLTNPRDSIAILSGSEATNIALTALLKHEDGMIDQIECYTDASIATADVANELTITSLLASKEQGVERTRLEQLSTLTLGRNPSKCRVIFNSGLTLISGVHAEIQVDGEGKLNIKDLGSLNGTFLNGRRLSAGEWSRIKASDVVTLGASSLVDCSSQLTFSHLSNQNNTAIVYQPLITAWCLIIVVDDLPSEQILHWLSARVRNSFASSVRIIIDRSRYQAKPEECDALKQKLLEIASDVGIYCFSLKPFILDGGNTLLIPEAQIDYELFVGSLRDKSRSDIDLQRSAKLHISLIAKSLESEVESSLAYYIHQEEITSVKEYSTGSTGTATTSKDFKRILLSRYDSAVQSFRSLLTERKAEMLDDFSPNSLARSLEKELALLVVESKNQNGDQVCIALIPPKESMYGSDSSLHRHMLSFCHRLLKDWYHDLIDRAMDDKSRLGLKSLYSDASTELGSLTSSQPQTVNLRPQINVDLSMILRDNIAPPDTFLLIRFPSFLGYIFNNLRGQIMSIGGTIVIVGGMLTPQIRDGIKNTLLPALLPLIAVITWLAYNKELRQKSEEVSEKLKKEVKSYYFSYLKITLDKISISLLSSFSDEQSRFAQKLDELITKQQPATAKLEPSKENREDSHERVMSPKIMISRLKRQLDTLGKIIQDIDLIPID